MGFYLENAGHLLPYAILLLLYFYISLQGELVKHRLFDAPVLGILILFAGFREAITPDMERYRQMYESIGSGEFLPLEPSFVLFSRLLYWLGFDYHAFFFLFTFLTLLFIYLGIRNYTSQVKLSLLLYVLIPSCFLNLFVEMREACAIAVAFYAMSVFARKDLRYRIPFFLLLVIFSYSFHFSAILYWPIVLMFYRFLKKPHSIPVYLVLLIATLLTPTTAFIGAASSLAFPLVPPRYQGYILIFMDIIPGPTESGQLLKTLIYDTIAVSFVFWRRPMQHKDEDHVPLNLFVLGVVILNLTRSLAAASRLAYFFLIYQIILFPAMLQTVKARINRLTATYAVVMFYLLQFTWGLFLYSEEADNYPFLHFQNVILSLLR